MADGGPNLNLTPEEKRVFYQLFQAADTTNLGVVTGEVAVSFFEKTSLPPDTLGLIWQIADTQNRGLLTPSGFGVVLRLIGHAQAGRAPTEELSLQPGPLPKFVGLSDGLAARVAEARTATASPPPPPAGGNGPIRVPPLNPDDINKFASLFEKSDVQNGLLSGETAKQIFERARLPNEVLGRIWNLSDTKQRGALDGTEFIIAMHLLTSYKTGSLRGLPQTLPQGLYDVAARRGVARNSTGSRASDVPPVPAIPKQFSGSGPVRTASPITRPPQYGSPLSAQSTGGDWLVNPQEKAHFDTIFATVDKAGFGQINGEQAVTFFTNAQLPEETLAQIWDLADIDSDGQLSKDEFAVAMYLVRQQRSKKEPLPQVLPPALIPPSMRRQAAGAAPRQPPAAPAPAPPTASDDLFGLDAFTTPSQVPQSTGESNGAFPPTSPTRASPPSASSSFKPFIPSSSFGQSLTPQATGVSSPQNRTPAQPADDLLGDNDPEESKKLTQETSELGNLSNQVSSLSKEMQNVQGKRASTEQEIAHNTQQKRDFEARLAQARAMYDQEVKNFKALEERLAASRTETKKLQQDFTLIDGSRQDLQNQFHQVSTALESDQRENASLKEKIRQANTEVTQLKPKLEKVRSEARQQKGLVAINKKQLATVEGERDRLRDDIDAASKETEEGDQNVAPPAAVSSPAASVASQSTNPFFRRTATGSTDNALASPDTTREKPNDAQSAFDSFFGPSLTSPASSAPPPPTSFRADSYGSAASGLKGSDTSGNPTPSTSPPPPPQSRQITPSILPLRENSQQSASTTSSVKVSPPASRFGPPATTSEADTSVPSTSPGTTDKDKADSTSNGSQKAIPPAITVDTNAEARPDSLRSDSLNESKNLPGAFPEVPESAQAGKEGQTDVSFDELFGSVARERSPSQKANDFEEAMASMTTGNGRKTDAPKTNGDAAPAKASEFPPIREIDDDDDDDSTDSEALGFDDDFTAVSPPRNTGSSSQQKGEGSDDPEMRAFPPIEGMTGSGSQLPGADAQVSPPSYDNGGAKETSAEFPPEFNGLLPNRADPTAPPDAPHSVEASTGAPVIGGVAQHSTGASAGSKKAGPADFEAAFAGLDLAPAEADEDDDDDPFESHTNKDSTDFDLSFDSPSQAKPADAGPAVPGNQATSADFFDFNSNNASATSPFAPESTAPAPNTATKPATHDWDALFSTLEAPKKTDSGESDGKESAGTPGTARPPGWALGVDTGEDDLILKRLTGMGYPRDESLAALEKFDYNIDKAADFLTSKT